MIEFTIPGKVQPQERPRFSKWGTYDAPKSKAYKEYVKSVAHINKPPELLKGALIVELDVYIEAPEKFKKELKRPKKDGLYVCDLRPTHLMDPDNLAKGLLDGMTGIIWKDDGQIVELVVRKFYGLEPRAVVRIISLQGELN